MWCRKLLERHSIASITLHGEVGSVDVGRCHGKGCGGDSEDVRRYPDKFILNIDKTGILYGLLPKNMYLGGRPERTASV